MTATPRPTDPCPAGGAHLWRLGPFAASTASTPGRCAKCGAERVFQEPRESYWRMSGSLRRRA